MFYLFNVIHNEYGEKQYPYVKKLFPLLALYIILLNICKWLEKCFIIYKKMRFKKKKKEKNMHVPTKQMGSHFEIVFLQIS